MKYTGYFSDNSDCANRRPWTGTDSGAAIEFETLEDLYRYAILIAYGRTTWQEYLDDEELEEDLTLEELEEAVEGLGIDDGSPFLFYATAENGNVIYDIGAVDGWGDEPAYRLEGEEADFCGLDDIEIPHKVISAYVLQEDDEDDDDWDDEDEDWDDDAEDGDEDMEENEYEYLKYLLRKEKTTALDSEERREMQELLDKYGQPKD